MRNLTGAWSALGLMLALSFVGCGGSPTEADRDAVNVERASPYLSTHAPNSPVVAAAQANTRAEGSSPAILVVGGRTYGPKDGLVIEKGVVTLARGAPTDSAAPQGWAIFSKTSYEWGPSYASSIHWAILKFTGSAYAAANVYASEDDASPKRIIQVCFHYIRDSKDITGWVCSTASRSGTEWSPGQVASLTIDDNLSGGPVTQFMYQRAMIDPSAF